MALLIGVLAVLFVVALVLSEGRWGQRWRRRWHDAGYTGFVGGDSGGGGGC